VSSDVPVPPYPECFVIVIVFRLCFLGMLNRTYCNWLLVVGSFSAPIYDDLGLIEYLHILSSVSHETVCDYSRDLGCIQILDWMLVSWSFGNILGCALRYLILYPVLLSTVHSASLLFVHAWLDPRFFGSVRYVHQVWWANQVARAPDLLTFSMTSI